MSTAPELLTIHKSEAVFCANCEHIAPRQRDGRCPRCGSDAVLQMSAILERTPDSVTQTH